MHIILIRGISGSGKSTLAKYLNLRLGYEHVEADQYFLNSDGVYKFDHLKLGLAHEWCLAYVRHLITRGAPGIVVSNTFTRHWEMSPYLNLAHEFNIPHDIIECTGRWESIHNVPIAVLLQQAQRWEPVKRSQLQLSCGSILTL